MHYSYGQNTREWTTNGNTVDSTAYIGTNNASCLRFRSNNVERMRITESGKVGIGVSNPQVKLQVNGRVRIDSSLVVDDSVVFNETAHVRGDLLIDGDVTIDQGTLSIRSLIDTSLHGKGLLMINESGDVVNAGKLQSYLYDISTETITQCLEGPLGNPVFSPPVWQHENHGMFLIDQACHYSPRLGVGVKPTAKLQVRNPTVSVVPLLIEQKETNNTIFKLFQIESNGNLTLRNNNRIIFRVDGTGENTLHARRIVVDQHNWADYVFAKDYSLMPINKLSQYIETNGHLPGVPTTAEVKENGVDVAKMNKILLEKVEQLTLYTIQLKEELEELKAKVQELEK